MTLRAMTIAARAVRNLAVAAPVALLNMTTERRRAVDRNCPQRLLLLIRERMVQMSSGTLGRGGGKCRPAPTSALSSHRKQVIGVRQSIQGTDGGAHRQVRNV